MKYKPTLLDVSTDLKRAIYASLGKEGFQDIECQYFFSSALKNFENYIRSIRQTNKEILIAKSKMLKKEYDDEKKRENLLLAADLLQYSQ